jgi:hypothetical protein
MIPWFLASGIVGVVPIACSLGAPKRLIATIVPPTRAVARAMKSMNFSAPLRSRLDRSECDSSHKPDRPQPSTMLGA